MAHTLDTSAAITASTANPVTKAYTCGAGATILVLALGVAGAVERAGGAPTYNGLTLTQADITRKYTTSPETSVELWYLLNPPTGASYNVSIPNTGAKSIWGVVSTYKAQAGYGSVFDIAIGGYGLSANPLTALTPSIAGDVLVVILGDGNSSVPTARSHTSLATQDWGQYIAAAQYGLIAGTGEVTISFTIASDDWGLVAAMFKEAILPAAPTAAHTDSKTDVQIVMHWTDNATNETGYKMYKNDVYLETIAAGSVSYTFTGLTASTQYDLAVKATNAVGDSAEAQLTETTSAEMYGILYESQPTHTGHINNLYGVDASTYQTITPATSHYLYKLKVSLYKNGSPTGTVCARVLTSSGTLIDTSETKTLQSISTGVATFLFNGTAHLIASTVYRIQLLVNGGTSSAYISWYLAYTTNPYAGGARNGSGNDDYYFQEYGDPSATPSPPAAPSGAAVSSRTETTLTMGWNDNSSNETGFEVFLDDVLVTTVDAGTVTYQFTGLLPSVSHKFSVKAYALGYQNNWTAAGESAESAVTANATSYLLINIGDTFKDALLNDVQINIGDVWKPVREMKINIGDVWKVLFHWWETTLIYDRGQSEPYGFCCSTDLMTVYFPQGSVYSIKSTDGARTWLGSPNDLVTLGFHGAVLVCSDNGQTIIGFYAPGSNGTEKVDVSTSAGASPTEYTISFGAFLVKFASSSSDCAKAVAITEGDAVYISINTGQTWTLVTDFAGNYAAAYSKNGNLVAVGDANGNVWISTNDGGSWTSHAVDTLGTSHEVGAIWCSSDGVYIYAMAEHGVYVSDDSGSTWTRVIADTPYVVNTPGYCGGGVCSTDGAISVAAIRPYAGATTTRVYVSTDYGVTWTLVDPASDIRKSLNANSDMTQIIGFSVNDQKIEYLG